MAEMDFEIHGRDVAAATFKDAVARAVALLGEFDSAISARPHGSLKWYVSRLHSNGSLALSFYPKVKPVRNRREKAVDYSSAVTSSFLSGFYDLETKCETPSYLSEFGLLKADSLASLIGRNGATGFRFASNDRSVEITHKTSENIGKLLPVRRKAIGSVEGKLEAINVHRNAKFIVYHAITNKGVTCEFPPEKFMEKAKLLLGKRVVASGVLYKNVNGDTIRMSVERLESAENMRRIVSIDEFAAEPDFAKTSSTAEYLRRIRGE